jgi:DNA-binding GntR family transcriptional regulator
MAKLSPASKRLPTGEKGAVVAAWSPTVTWSPSVDEGAAYSFTDATATARAMREILERIRELRLEPGRAFTESELATELDMGKTPVREALLIIGAQGFVFPRPRSGYRVSPITVKETRDLFVALRTLSAECAAMAATRGIDTKVLLHLEDLDVDIAPVTDADAREMVSGHVDFYGHLAAESGSRRLRVQMAWLLNDFARLLYLTFRGGNPARRPDGQAEVVAALRTGDPDAARAATRRLTDAWELAVVGALLESDVLQDVNLAPPPAERPAARSSRATPKATKKPAPAPAKKAAKKRSPRR